MQNICVEEKRQIASSVASKQDQESGMFWTKNPKDF